MQRFCNAGGLQMLNGEKNKTCCENLLTVRMEIMNLKHLNTFCISKWVSMYIEEVYRESRSIPKVGESLPSLFKW